MKKARRFWAILLSVLMLLSALPAEAATALPAGRDTAACEGGHSWGAWEIDVQATCMRQGLRSHRCKNCGYSDEEHYGPLGHNWKKDMTLRHATCIQQGEVRQKCSHCGVTRTVNTDYAAHKFGEWVVTVEPTQLTAGTEERKCSVCGKTETRNLYPEGTLFRGDRGDAVKELQEKLNEAGFDCGEADGIFGKKTEDALAAFGESNGYPADGIAWPGIQDALALNTDVILELLSGVLNGDGTATFSYRMSNVGDTVVQLTTYRYERDGEMANQESYKELTNVGNDRLAPGESKEIALTVRIDQLDMDAQAVVRSMYYSYSIVYDADTREPFTLKNPVNIRATFDRAPDSTYHTNTVTTNLPLANLPTAQAEPNPLPTDGVPIVVDVDFIKSVSAQTPYTHKDEHYHEGDIVRYELSFTNQSEFTYRDVEIVDPLHGSNEDAVVDRFETVEPGETVATAFDYRVTAADVQAGIIFNQATAYWYVNEEYPQNQYASNPVNVATQRCEEAVSASVSKTVVSTPENGAYFVEGETIQYEIVFANTGSVELLKYTMEDMLAEGDHVIYRGENLASGDSITVPFAYTVTAEDVSNLWVQNYVTVEFEADTDEMYTNYVSDSTVSMTNEPFTAAEIIKYEVSTPANGSYYVEGETISYEIEIANTGNTVFDGGHDTYDSLAPGDGWIGGGMWIAPGHRFRTIKFDYTVTADDVLAGQVVNTAWMTYTAYPYPGRGEDGIVYSNEVVSLTGRQAEIPTETPTPEPTATPMPTPVPTVMSTPESTATPMPEFPVPTLDPDFPFGVITEMEIVKKEVSTPANGSYYVEGETIAYEITYSNIGEVDFGECIVYDALAGGSGEIGSEVHLYAGGDSRTLYFDYTVTADDAAQGYVVNSAMVVYDVCGYLETKLSNKVVSLVGGDIAMLPPDGKIETPVLLGDEGEEYAPCSHALLSRNDTESSYQLHFCPIHSDAPDTIRTMYYTSDSEQGRLKALQFGRTLYEAELDAMYEALLLAADPIAKIDVMNERVQFYAMLACFEEALNGHYPDRPLLVAEKIAEVLAKRCVDMCYELHTAPEPRKDSPRGIALSEGGEPAENCSWTIEELNNGDFITTYRLCDDLALTLSMGAQLEADMRSKLWQFQLQQDTKLLLEALPEAEHEAVKIDYLVFGNWIAAREALLRDFYPEDDDTVAEVILQLMLEKGIEICK